ncbi:response regulator transcription factor [Streptomyces asoensis]|uniref:Response regulator transcription factor n=1 Tax=Streptomyces asoensis TaxID=249586 RepID=A0A6M4X1D9_9ACTN|nr:response regulator transcription factor [Streptomyces asoensis]QJT06620.1 response regulator transcription factor [Streptomyces asoensis]
MRSEPPLTRGAGRSVLVITGEPDLAELLVTSLEPAGYRVGLTGTATEALARLGAHRFDLLVVDTARPDLTGVDAVGRPVIAHRPPVLYLASDDFLDRLLPELDLGQKDYVTKPLRVPEVLTRMRLLLRGTAPGRPGAGGDAPGYGDLVLDDTLCRARRGTRDLDLTPAEYRLLRHLLDNAHRVLSKEQIGRYVWGEFRGDNAIEQLVSRLRRKVDQEAAVLIHTRRGFGYWLGKENGEG